MLYVVVFQKPLVVRIVQSVLREYLGRDYLLRLQVIGVDE